MPHKMTLKVNGKTHTVTAESDAPLLYILRNDVGLDGVRFGCGVAQCGACAVLKDGVEIRSCVTPVSAVIGSEITSAEGLGSPEHPNRLQRAFIAEQAAQCGYCTAGMTIAATALLNRNPHPTRAQIVESLDGHLCRCATYVRYVRAVERASKVNA